MIEQILNNFKTSNFFYNNIFFLFDLQALVTKVISDKLTILKL